MRFQHVQVVADFGGCIPPRVHGKSCFSKECNFSIVSVIKLPTKAKIYWDVKDSKQNYGDEFCWFYWGVRGVGGGGATVLSEWLNFSLSHW